MFWILVIISDVHFSRLSGGSTQSDVLQSKEKKKKKGLLGKLKKLTKSRSIDDGVSDFRTGINQVIMEMTDCYIITTWNLLSLVINLYRNCYISFDSFFMFLNLWIQDNPILFIEHTRSN